MARLARTKTGANAHEEQLLDVIGAIYDAALSPELWPDTLSRVSHLCGARWMVFSVNQLDPVAPVAIYQNAGADPRQLALLTGPFATPDTNPGILPVLASPPGRINLREETITDAQWERTEFYNAVYRPFGLYAALGLLLLKSADAFVPIGVASARSRGRFENEQLAMLSRVAPHLQRAMQLMLRLDAIGGRADVMQAAWDRLSSAVMVLDEASRLLWANRAGEAMLARGDGIAARDGVPVAATKDTDRELRKLIAAARIGSARDLDAGGALLLPRPAPRRPLSALVSPLRAGGLDGVVLSRRAAVMLCIVDPDQHPVPPEATLMRLFRLTRAEAGLAARLARGRTVKQAAGALGIAASTARIHLQRVMNKTGAHRQSELIRLLVATIPSVCSE